jgi:hypothetical protein
MNYRLLAYFLIFELVEFTVFWGIATLVASYFGVNTVNIFLAFVGIDIITTVAVYQNQIKSFIVAVLRNDDVEQ